jgi:predicted O-linked N-acetylglucosamine transferase (SPINDLY family)
VLRERLFFAERVDFAAHIRRAGAADLFLDSLLYNAHTTGAP